MQVNPEEDPPEIYVTWSDPQMTNFENAWMPLKNTVWLPWQWRTGFWIFGNILNIILLNSYLFQLTKIISAMQTAC